MATGPPASSRKQTKLSLTGDFSGFSVEVKPGGTAVITFTRPERLNGLTPGLKRDLVEWLALAELDDSVRVIVFTGSGRAFSAGDDISDSADSPDRQNPTLVRPRPGADGQPIRTYGLLRLFNQEVPRVIRALDKITIAAINGVAIQSGLTLALACDFRFAAESARLGSATLRMGYLPDEGGHWLLVQHMGLAKALDFVLRHRIVPAAEALDLGLVNEVCADATVLSRSLELARELGSGPQVAMRLAKRALYQAYDLTFEQAGEDIAVRAALSDYHADAREGREAFLEKRPASFNQWLESSE